MKKHGIQRAKSELNVEKQASFTSCGFSETFHCFAETHPNVKADFMGIAGCCMPNLLKSLFLKRWLNAVARLSA